MKITGRIDTRSSEEIILKSISIIQNDQEYSYSGKLQCELENMKTAMITAGAVTEEEKTLKIGQQIVLEGLLLCFRPRPIRENLMRRHTMRPRVLVAEYGRHRFWPQGRSTAFCGKNCMDSGRCCMTGLQKFSCEEASVMQTLLLGEKEELDAEVKALYQKNGIAHILSISGLHITLLGMGYTGCLRDWGYLSGRQQWVVQCCFLYMV